jgi:hypothetical protein
VTFVPDNNGSAGFFEAVSTDGNLTYNPNTNNLSTTTFTGALAGNATTATSAGAVNTINTFTNATFYPTFVADNNGTATAESVFTTSNITYNPSTGNFIITTGAISGGFVTLANGATAMGFATRNVTKVTPTATATYTTTVPQAGTKVSLFILTSGTTSYTITFGTGFKAAGNLTTGTVTARLWVIPFTSDGINLYQTAAAVNNPA